MKTLLGNQVEIFTECLVAFPKHFLKKISSFSISRDGIPERILGKFSESLEEFPQELTENFLKNLCSISEEISVGFQDEI